MNSFQCLPVAWVHNTRTAPVDDHWEDVLSEIHLDAALPEEAFEGIESFSHLDIVYRFHMLDPADMVYAGHPRGNPDFPRVGIFAQRKKDRPNALGLSSVELLGRKGRVLTVKYLDAIDGTPVLDIKPVFREFMPAREVHQPGWVADLMRAYWRSGAPRN